MDQAVRFTVDAAPSSYAVHLLLPLLLLAAACRGARAILCDTPLCLGPCREACNAITLNRLVKAVIGGVPPGYSELEFARKIYTDDAVMAVVPIGLFEGALTAFEYITLFSRKGASVPSVANATGLTLRQVVLVGDVAVVAHDVSLVNPWNATYGGILRGTSMLKFDANSRIKFHSFDWPMWSEAVRGLNYPATNTPEVQGVNIDLICRAHQASCRGANQQYETVDTCKAFMVSIDALAPIHRLAGNNVACRMFHARYIDVDPDVHCPHIGPSGGGKCTEDLPYTPDKVDPLIPPLTFFYANPLIAGLLRQVVEEGVDSVPDIPATLGDLLGASDAGVAGAGAGAGAGVAGIAAGVANSIVNGVAGGFDAGVTNSIANGVAGGLDAGMANSIANGVAGSIGAGLAGIGAGGAGPWPVGGLIEGLPFGRKLLGSATK
ncbi:MAG: hypothetical protein J3K34DRAFT_522429 [Monoraphidium minutum]|nr:MAG: hypothetical protein J3K34DRAFT_522429 [Monoraphidium minutum]